MTSKQKKMLYRIITAFVLFVVLMVLEHTGVLEQLPSQWLVFLIYLIPYLVIGYDIVYKAVRNIRLESCSRIMRSANPDSPFPI